MLRGFAVGIAVLTPRFTTERRFSLADARYVVALAEVWGWSPDALALLLRPYVAE